MGMKVGKRDAEAEESEESAEENKSEGPSDSDYEVCPHCCNCSLLRQCICRAPGTAPEAASLDAAAGTK